MWRLLELPRNSARAQHGASQVQVALGFRIRGTLVIYGDPLLGLAQIEIVTLELNRAVGVLENEGPSACDELTEQIFEYYIPSHFPFSMATISKRQCIRAEALSGKLQSLNLKWCDSPERRVCSPPYLREKASGVLMSKERNHTIPISSGSISATGVAPTVLVAEIIAADTVMVVAEKLASSADPLGTLKEVIAVSRTWKLIAGLKIEDFRRAYQDLHALFAKSNPACKELKNLIVESLTGGCTSP